jgi:hypothetical protein
MGFYVTVVAVWLGLSGVTYLLLSYNWPKMARPKRVLLALGSMVLWVGLVLVGLGNR